MEDILLHEQIAACIDLDQNRPLNDSVYEGLRKAVIIGVIPVGERINQQNLSEFMHISRTPIRKSIEKLKDEGLLEEIPNFGVVIKRVTIEDAEEIYAIRVSLDTLATITAMNRMTYENHAEMDDLLKRTVIANEAGQVEKTIELFKEFNDKIYEFARMPRLIIIVKQLREYLARFRDISLYSQNRRDKALFEHILIHHSMKTNNEDVIKDIIKDHLEYSLTFVIEEIERFESAGLASTPRFHQTNEQTTIEKR